ncbi:MAG: proline dehydrogenase [Streptosporangiales bacterium]|nr:proline dehydrogenase [Streptosporangiales bacterium]
MLRRVLLSASHSEAARRFVSSAPLTRGIVDRFVAGERIDDAFRVVESLSADGLLVSLEPLGEDTLDPGQAEATTKEYVGLLDRIGESGLARGAEISVKPTAVGLNVVAGGRRLALDNALRICEAARAAGTTITLDAEDYVTVEATMEMLAELRREFPNTGAVVQSYLRRAESYCRELSGPGSRVRLCKGAYDAPESVAHPTKREVDRSYVRCLKILMAGQGYPMVATHDPRLIAIAGALAALHGRGKDSFEYQMLYGVRDAEQRRLAAAGAQVRVYVPYGTRWYPYLMRRLAERPANLAFFMRSLISRT